MCESLSGYFPKEGIQMANEHVKYLTLLGIWDVMITIIMKYYIHPLEL